MHEEGHLLTFLNDFLEKNMHRIGRSEKTETESHWLSKTNYNFNEREMSAIQREHSEAEKLIKQLTSEIDDAKKHSETAQKVTQQLMSQRDDARKDVEELFQLILQKFIIYSNLDLQDATNNFHESRKLGEGGFGVVYKGILPNSAIAIKILKEGSRQGAREFFQEIEILTKVRHPNLVTFKGACLQKHAVIYEYLPNGSLQDRLSCKNNTLPLSWQARIRVAFDICSALSCLHSSQPHGFVHGDLKPSNILLDSSNISKISDFGLCRELNSTDSASVPCHSTDVLKGTPGYIDPEYSSSGNITPQSDVYSFDIILLQLVTCKHQLGIRNSVEAVRQNGTLKRLIDASACPWPFKLAQKMISLGLRCSDPVTKNRPDLSTKVLKQIESMLQVDSASTSSWATSLLHG